MDSLFDLLHRLVTGPQLSEFEQGTAHRIVAEAELKWQEIRHHFEKLPAPAEAPAETPAETPTEPEQEAAAGVGATDGE